MCRKRRQGEWSRWTGAVGDCCGRLTSSRVEQHLADSSIAPIPSHNPPRKVGRASQSTRPSSEEEGDAAVCNQAARVVGGRVRQARRSSISGGEDSSSSSGRLRGWVGEKGRLPAAGLRVYLHDNDCVTNTHILTYTFIHTPAWVQPRQQQEPEQEQEQGRPCHGTGSGTTARRRRPCGRRRGASLWPCCSSASPWSGRPCRRVDMNTPCTPFHPQ